MSSNDWHRAEIVAAVRMRGTSLRQLAIDNGLYEKSCQSALNRPYEKPERLIADTIGVHPMVIWPSRYHPSGERKRFLHSKMVSKYQFANSKTDVPNSNEKTIICLTNSKEEI